jgi:hypothetical protein
MENTELNQEAITPGSKYSHYKHPEMLYEIIGVGTHSETLETLIIYRALYDSAEWGNNHIWARPIAMFSDTVEINGKTIPRFTLVEKA